MVDFLEQFTDGNFHAEFLADFPDKTLLEGFARLAFAAGKFPKTAQMGIRVPLSDEQFAVAEDERSADLNQL